MYDSVTAADIPPEAVMVGGYVNGAYAWSEADWARFPDAVHVTFSTDALDTDALVLDVEFGDARPAQAPGWVRAAQVVTGCVPTLYGSAATVAACNRLIRAARLVCDFGLADWTGHAHLPPGFAFCQYASPTQGSGGHFDVSMVADDWPRPLVSSLRPPPPGSSSPIPSPAPPPIGAVGGHPVETGGLVGVVGLGSTGPEVLEVQSRLAARGWRITVDGIFGPKTQAVVRQFQDQVHVAMDGVVGPVTWDKLWSAPITP
jgi:hypothetical protein